MLRNGSPRDARGPADGEVGRFCHRKEGDLLNTEQVMGTSGKDGERRPDMEHTGL